MNKEEVVIIKQAMNIVRGICMRQESCNGCPFKSKHCDAHKMYSPVSYMWASLLEECPERHEYVF